MKASLLVVDLDSKLAVRWESQRVVKWVATKDNLSAVLWVALKVDDSEMWMADSTELLRVGCSDTLMAECWAAKLGPLWAGWMGMKMAERMEMKSAVQLVGWTADTKGVWMAEKWESLLVVCLECMTAVQTA